MAAAKETGRRRQQTVPADDRTGGEK
jgi:hypothetical protein